MTQKIARYSISNGLAGCYTPDNVGGPYAFATRRELVAAVEYEVEFHDFPKRTLRQVNFVNIWRFIQRNGSSVAHFSIQHNGYEIAFHGLTEDEFNQMDRENEFA